MDLLLLPGGVEVLEPEVGYERGQDDGERRGEAFEDVVGVLDDRRDDQTPQRLEKQQTHRPRWTKAQPACVCVYGGGGVGPQIACDTYWLDNKAEECVVAWQRSEAVPAGPPRSR